jgi:hypothetical protein
MSSRNKTRSLLARTALGLTALLIFKWTLLDGKVR